MRMVHEQYNGYEGQSVHPIIIDVYSNRETKKIQHLIIRSNDPNIHGKYKQIGKLYADLEFVCNEHNPDHDTRKKYSFVLKSRWRIDFDQNQGVPIELFVFHPKYIMDCSDNWKLHNSGKIFPKSDVSSTINNPNLVSVKTDNREFLNKGYIPVVRSGVCIWLGKIC